MVEPARVALDGRSLTDASAFRGIGTYTRNLVAGLATDPRLQLTVLCEPAAELPPGAQRQQVRRRAPGRWRDREHDLLLPWDLRRLPADVLMAPSMDVPRRSPYPLVQTLHDAWPAMASDSAASAASWRRVVGRYRDAAAVVTVSRWSADAALRELGLDPARVHVVPHGVADAFRPGAGPADPPYLLFVGEFDPRKRHEHAFAAVALLAEQGLPCRLVVTGRIAPWYAGALADLVAASPRPDLVEVVGHVPFEELVALYQGASALLVTSEGEGFGFPALEAMACGAPVVAYDNSATPEVVGDAGILVPDGDVAALVEATARLLRSEQERAARREQGLQRAAGFTWERSARAHADLLLATAGG